MKTSITTTSADNLINKGNISDQLGCDNIPGFHLKKTRDRAEKKLQNGKTKIISAAGVYRFRYTDEAGKRRTVKIGDAPAMKPQQAAEIAISWRVGMTKGEADPLAAKRERTAQKRAESFLEVGKFFDEVYTSAMEEKSGKERAKATLNKIKSNFQSLWHIPMSDLTVHDIRRWEAEMLQRDQRLQIDENKVGVWYTTRRSYFGAFSAMLKYAAGEKSGHVNDEPVLKEYPLKGVKLNGATHQEKEKQPTHDQEYDLSRDLLTDEEHQKIQAGLKLYGDELKGKRSRSLRLKKNQHLTDLSDLEYPEWFIPFCHIARLTGMRPSDALNLKWENIKQLHSKATEYPILQFKPRKTDHHENPILVEFPIFGELAEVLKIWRQQQGNPKSGFIFPSDKMALQGIQKPWSRKVYIDKWQRVLELAGVRQEIHFYCFRHNFISNWVNQGLAPLEIAAFVGHRDGDMIARHYFKLDLNRSVEKMQRFYNNAETTSPAKLQGVK